MKDNRFESLAEEIRRWSERPPSLSPRQARTRVLAHLPERRRRPIWRLLAGGATLAAAVLVVMLLVGRPPQPAGGPPVAASPPDAQRMIVHQLSSGTQLYIVMRPDAFANGS